MNLRQFDLNLLVALDALLIERNVTRAGERLHLSQPAMSGILARLRHVFNDELLVRVGRHLEPTAFAAELARPVRACVQGIEDLLSTQRAFSPQTEARTFVIAASDYVVLLLLGPLVKRLTALAPNIGVRFVSLESSVADRLAMGEIDFCVVPTELDPAFPSVPLFDDSWICAVWSGAPDRGRSIDRRRVPRVAASHVQYLRPRAHLAGRRASRAGRVRAQDRRVDRQLRDRTFSIARDLARYNDPAAARR